MEPQERSPGLLRRRRHRLTVEAINGRLAHLRGTAQGFRNLAHYILRLLLHSGQLPMRRRTVKQGRPYTLVVTRTEALFDDEAQRRAWATHELERLRVQ